MRFNFKLEPSQWGNLVRNALIVAAAAALTFVAQHVTPADFGAFGPFVVGLIAVVIDFLHKSVQTN